MLCKEHFKGLIRCMELDGSILYITKEKKGSWEGLECI